MEVFGMSTNDRLIYQVFLAQNSLRTYLKKALTVRGIHVSVTQAGILFLLKQKDGQSMTELSQALAIDNSTITGLVDRLEKNGFVRRDSSSGDRRMFRIYVTPQGVEESKKAKVVINEVNGNIKSGFSNDEIEIFTRVLNSFSEKFCKD
jgi:DNA-binding MarR family transcriptional regulator